MRNVNKFETNFDRWLFMTSDQRRNYNPFLEFLSDSIKNYPEVNKVETQDLVDEKIKLEISQGEFI